MNHRETRPGSLGPWCGCCLMAVLVACSGGTSAVDPAGNGEDEPWDETTEAGGKSGGTGGQAGPTTGASVPIAPVLHRLNRTELSHALRDLLGSDRSLLADLPADNITNGFDNVGDGLSVSSTHVDVA